MKWLLIDDVLRVGFVQALAYRLDLMIEVEQILEAAVLFGLVAGNTHAADTIILVTLIYGKIS